MEPRPVYLKQPVVFKKPKVIHRRAHEKNLRNGRLLIAGFLLLPFLVSLLGFGALAGGLFVLGLIAVLYVCGWMRKQDEQFERYQDYVEHTRQLEEEWDYEARRGERYERDQEGLRRAYLRKQADSK